MQMKLSRPLARGVVLVLGLVVLAGSLAGTASASAGRTTLRHGPVQPVTLMHDSITSSNWAGYAVAPTSRRHGLVVLERLRDLGTAHGHLHGGHHRPTRPSGSASAG